MNKQKMHCGFIAIVGRPNVGKSTLLNRLLGKKISITSRKPQTTRYRIIGIQTESSYQAIYVDTPGFHIRKGREINRCLIKRATNSTICDVELIIFVVEGTNWKEEDEIVLNKLKVDKTPVLLAINKVDNITDKSILLPHIRFLIQKMDFMEVVPISAEKGKNVDTIASIVRKCLPVEKHYFPERYITDRSQRFMASEIIREKLMRFLGVDLPYITIVEIEKFIIKKSGSYHINALILVKRESQKKIVVGYHGAKIKTISMESRKDMEALFETKIYLELWVKIRSSLTDDKRALYNSIGYVNDF